MYELLLKQNVVLDKWRMCRTNTVSVWFVWKVQVMKVFSSVIVLTNV